MPKSRKYIFNEKTLSYETIKWYDWSRLLRFAATLAASLVLAMFYWWVYSSVLGKEMPKTAILRKRNAAWCARIEVLSRNLDAYDEALETMRERDDGIYRSIFGLEPIPSDIRNSGLGGEDRYPYLEELSDPRMIGKIAVGMDMLTKKAYVQSKSYDDIASLSKKAGDFASCIPCIVPLVPEKFRISSTFGYRSDPFLKSRKQHTGIDFATDTGTPLYAAGAGVVEKVEISRRGYGNYVLIDHGFGYKTRYAHMSTIFVEPGEKVKMGSFIGRSGNSGRSSGPHLHYEVMYMGKYVNPANYFDLSVTVEEYREMIRPNASATSEFTVLPMHIRQR